MAKAKTYKREFATGAVWLPFLLLVAVTAFQGDSTVQLEIIRLLWLPTTAIVAGAFGLDAVAKQLQNQPPVASAEPADYAPSSPLTCPVCGSIIDADGEVVHDSEQNAAQQP